MIEIISEYFRKKFEKRTLYLVHYSFYDVNRKEIIGEGTTNFKINLKINSFNKLSYIRGRIKKILEEKRDDLSTDDIEIIIKNIIKLD